MLRATLRSLLARKLRLLLSATAVVLGVAFTAGAFVLTDSLGRVFDDLFGDLGSTTDVQVRAADSFAGGGGTVRPPVTEDLLTRLRAVDGVAAAAGDVEGFAELVVDDGADVYRSAVGAPTIGVNYDPEPALGTLVLREGAPPAGPGQVAVDAFTAGETGLEVGDDVQVQVVDGTRTLTLSGVFGVGEDDSLAGAAILAFDTPTAQELLGRPGEYSVLRLQAAEGVSQDELVARVEAVLPEGVEAVSGAQGAQEDSDEVSEALGFVNVFLLAFAGVALFVGAFLISNTFAILVAQRTRELALLRALGASRGQVTRSVLVEALVVGLVASVVGLGAGVGLAAGLRAVAGDALPDGPLVVSARTVVVSLLVGVVVTLLAALLPARRASAVPPVAAMREATAPEASLRRTTVVGVVLLAVGVPLALVGLTGQVVPLVAGAVLVFLAVAALAPRIATPVTGLLGAPLARSLPGRLGRLNAMRNPRRTASTAAALMIGLALVSAVSIIGASAKASIDGIVTDSLGADLVLEGGFQGFPATVADTAAALPEVAAATALRSEAAQVDGAEAFVLAVPGAAVGDTLLLDAVEGSVDDLAAGQLLLSESEAEARGVGPGDRLPATFARGEPTELEVVGTYAPNAFVGDYVVELAEAERFSGRLATFVLVSLADGVSDADGQAAVRAALTGSPGVDVLTRDEFGDDQAGQVDVALTIVTVLLGLSVLIAVLGIVNTLALAVFERTREIGLLRAVGLGRRQTRAMVRVEAVVVALFGALLGVAVGTAFGVAGQRALADQGITELAVPYGRVLAFVLLAGLAGVLAAVLPARRAARLDVLRAVAST